MSQNKEQNVRTRREQLSTYPESVCVGRYPGDTLQLELDGDDLDADRLVEGPVLYVRCDIAHSSQTEAEARGAAEQRRKDAEACCPVHQVWNDLDAKWEDCPEGEKDWRWEHADECDQRIFYTHPANAAALEARAAKSEKALSEIVEMAEADCSYDTGPYLKIARAALTREGGV